MYVVGVPPILRESRECGPGDDQVTCRKLARKLVGFGWGTVEIDC